MEDQEVQKRIGTTLRDKWTLQRVLGVGGMAAVYVGVHKIGRTDAIKILHVDVARSKSVRDRFEQEAHAANRLKHPGVVEIRDIDTTEDGAPFLVMELLEGEPLSTRAKRDEAMPIGELLRLVDELLDVLAAAHAQGIIHRDIKPDNLFILGDGRLKVLDFGIARMREGAPKALHTRLGSTLGTVAYMPPEQTMGTKIDERADLFAVGATMFRLLARRYVHEAKSEMDLLVKMASDPAPPLAAVVPSAPRDVCLIVDRALAFKRENRYPDARTMQADVRAVRAGSPPPYATERLLIDQRSEPVRDAATRAEVGAVGGSPMSAGFSPTSGARESSNFVPGVAAPPVSLPPFSSLLPSAGPSRSPGSAPHDRLVDSSGASAPTSVPQSRSTQASLPAVVIPGPNGPSPYDMTAASLSEQNTVLASGPFGAQPPGSTPPSSGASHAHSGPLLTPLPVMSSTPSRASSPSAPALAPLQPVMPQFLGRSDVRTANPDRLRLFVIAGAGLFVLVSLVLWLALRDSDEPPPDRRARPRETPAADDKSETPSGSPERGKGPSKWKTK